MERGLLGYDFSGADFIRRDKKERVGE